MSAFTKYSHLPAYAEIANLEHELGVLKERRANGRQSVKMALPGFILTLGLAILLFIYAIITDNGDATAKLFLILFLVTLCALFAWVVKGTSLEKYLLAPSFFDGDPNFLEKAIAAREHRLAELKAPQ